MSRVSVMRSRFFWKIYLTFSVLFFCTTLIVSWAAFFRVQATIRAGLKDDLRAKVDFITPYAEDALGAASATGAGSNQDMVQRLGAKSGTRLTLIAPDGHVVADSDADLATIANHWQRPEVQDSLVEPYGFAERISDTVHERYMYVAKAIRKDTQLLGVARVSMSTAKLDRDLMGLEITIGLIGALGVALALAIGWTLAKRVTVPISEMMRVAEALRNGRYEEKVQTITGDELGQLGETLNQLGSELTNKITELHRLENVRRDFVANVSHEIKTPLTSIKGYVETLLGGALDDPANNVRFLEKIDRNALRLTALVQDILSLAKIEAGEESFKPSPVEWAPIINSVLARNEDSIQKRNLKIKVQAPAGPLTVMGEREAMTQVLDNLISNAIKYTPEGGRISVHLYTKNGWAKLEVEDTGIGIPSEHLDRIFERFYRVDKARSRELGGTGLGLSIVKHLVNAMHGDVGVESAVGIGSKFTVRLQLAT